MKSKLFIVVFLMLFGMMAFDGLQAQITERPEFGKFALVNAEVYTIVNGTIQNGTVLINGHRIEAVGEGISVPDGYEVIDLQGQRVYPGFIDAGTRLGLIEISAVPVTVDDAEIGNFNPQMRAFTAINPNSVSIPVTRVSGVTNVLAHPTSGVVAGKATFIDLFGYSPDSMAVRADAALHVSWPTAGRGGWWDQRDDEERRKQYERNLRALQEYFDGALAYHRMWEAWEASPAGKKKPSTDPELHAMRDVFTGALPVMITVDRERDILNAIEWTEKHSDIRFIFSSLSEGWRVADELAESGIPCLVGPILRTPSRAYDNYQRPYQNAGILASAGVKVAIRTGETENVRNLPYHAGYAAVYGMGVEEALKAITITPAKIFGVDDELGSIEAGKRANLFVADGDPFETLTNVSHVFINGYMVPMVSRHTQLYEQFLDRNP